MVVAVYLGSSAACGKKYYDIAYEVGKMIAAKGHTLCYGGATVGTMGALADGAQDNGGKVIGVFPRDFRGTKEMREKGINVRRENLDKMYDVENFAERKQVMEDLSDCAIVLPGSFGTMDELFTYACNHAIEKNNKLIHILNFEGYYDHIRDFLKTVEQEHFLKGTMVGVINFYDTLEELAKIL